MNYVSIHISLDQVNLPTVHSFQNSEAVAAPLLVEVQGGGKFALLLMYSNQLVV